MSLLAMYSIDFLDHQALPAIMSLIGRVIARQSKEGIEQWDDIYPDAVTFARDIGNFCQRGLFSDGNLIGIMSLNEYQDREYSEVSWELADPCPLMLHRLALDPDWQGKGLAQLMMHYAEEYARANGYASIRLDAYSLNPASLKLYRALGYSERGIVSYRKGQFICFEKIL